MLNEQCQTYLSTAGELDVRLFETSADCIKLIDLDGRVQKLNPGALSALELDDVAALHGIQWASLWPIESQEQVAQAVKNAVTGERTQFTAFCPTAKGTPRWWDVVVYPIRDTHGTVCEIMATSRDITELYLAREALKTAARYKDEFLLLLAHELRNPLSAASLAATMLETQTLDAARVQQLAQVVSRQVSHMSTLVEDLIDLARVTRGEVTLKLEPLDMRAVVGEVVEQLEGVIRSKRHTLNMDVGTTACMIRGDKVRLIQVLGNLLGNAARYTPEGGCIDISVRRQLDKVLVTVQDSGIGISAEHLPSIFEPFRQVDRTSERNGGLGLGLSLVKKLTELHDGSVNAASDGAGQGSVFVLTLPALP